MKKGVKRPGSETLAKVRSDIENLKDELRNDVTPAVVASFGFIIALVWRDAIRSVLNEFLQNAGIIEKAYIYDIVSALIVTAVVIIIMVTVTKLSRKKRRKRIQKAIEQKVEDVEKSVEKTGKKLTK